MSGKRVMLGLAIAITGCSVGSGILPAGPDMYTVTERRAPVLGGAMKAKEVALTEANAQCVSKGATFIVVSEQESAFPRGNPWGNTDYAVTFRCVVAVNAVATQPIFHTEPNIGTVPVAASDWRVAAPNMPTRLRTAALRPQDLFKIIAPSVYVVAATNDFTKSSQGSAVAISPSVLITNCHVVASFSLVFLKKDNDIGSATLMGGDTKADKCFLKTSDMKLTPIQGVRTFESVEVGEDVFALGNPKTLELTFSPGIVSAKRRDDGVDFVQTTAPIAPGSSGGGLFDARGNLIAITTFLLKGEGSLNFAIAADGFWN